MKDSYSHTIASQIAKVLPLHRKRTDRYIGYTTYRIKFETRRYKGTSVKPQKISILEKTIVKLIANGVTVSKSICKFLGLNPADPVEYILYSNSIQRLLEFGLINESEKKALSITSKGSDFIKTGVYAIEYQRNFEVVVIPKFPTIHSLHIITDNNNNIKRSKSEKYYTEDIALDKLKLICENQASHMHNPSKGLELISANLLDCFDCELDIYVCFLQNIRDNSIKTLVYENGTNSVIEELAVIFNSDIALRDSLLKDCLRNEIIKGTTIEIETGEKTLEQIEYEKRIIEEECNSEELIKSIKGPGSIYDSLEFEKELNDIFVSHNNEEIWLISPWIRDYAFINQRVPKIKEFLNKGGRVFLAYSQPEKIGEEMVQSASMSVLKNLEKTYDKFFYAELPKFHYKNVIEHKKGITTLYTGSFNVLSFTVNGHNEHYRQENMVQSNPEQANVTREDFLQLFRDKYINETINDLAKLKNQDKLYIGKLINLNIDKTWTELYNEIIKEASTKGVVVFKEREPYDEDIKKAAVKIIKLPYRAEEDFILANIAASLYLFKLSREKGHIYTSVVTNNLSKLLIRMSLYKYCRISFRKGKMNILNIVIGDKNFEFEGIEIDKKAYFAIKPHMGFIDFKEEGISKANDNIIDVFYDAAKRINIISA